MSWKEFFRPSWGKAIATFLLFILWVLLLSSYRIFCSSKMCAAEAFMGCVDYSAYLPMKGLHCGCGCTPFSAVVYQYVQFIFIPIAIAYLIVCAAAWLIGKMKRQKSIIGNKR